MNPLTDMLHLLLCNKQHVTDMMKIVDRKAGHCYYYLENDIAGGNEMPSHKDWIRITTNFKQTLNFSSDEQAIEFIKSCISISQEMQRVVSGNNHKMAFLKSILL